MRWHPELRAKIRDEGGQSSAGLVTTSLWGPSSPQAGANQESGRMWLVTKKTSKVSVRITDMRRRNVTSPASWDNPLCWLQYGLHDAEAGAPSEEDNVESGQLEEEGFARR